MERKLGFGAVALGAALLLSDIGGLHAQTCCAGDDHHVDGTVSSTSTASVTGLGETTPSALDTSSSANWHAYVFTRDNVRYVQINGLDGTVHMAVGDAAGSLFILPVGADTAAVVSSQVAGSKQVYSDLDLTISEVTDAAGVVHWYVVAAAAQ